WADGVTGHLHEYRREGEWRFWNAFDNRSYKNGTRFQDKWWPFEEQPYWADGLFQLAYILDDARLKGIARELVDRCLAGQSSDGYMGGWPEKPYSNEGDLYTQSLLFKALVSYQRATNDPRIVPALQRALRHIKRHCPPVLDNSISPAWKGGSYGWPSACHIIRSILWVYSKTNDPELMELTRAIHDAGQVHPGHFSTIQVRGLLTAADPVAGMHGVDTTELLEIPALYSLFSGNADDLRASIRGIAKVHELHGQIHGGPVSDEQLAQPNGAVVWTEMCDQATWSVTQETLLAITGQVQYADAVERIVFNVFPGSTRPDGKAAQYFTAPNLVACTRTSCQRGTTPRQRHLFCPDADPDCLCCIGEANRVYPNYVASAMWLSTPDRGLVAACFGPCTVTAEAGSEGKQVTIAEETGYPFDERIRFVIKGPHALAFPFSLRIPGWCENPSLTVNGARAPARGGGMARIDRLWRPGDTVELVLPMKVVLTARSRGAVAVERGPLVYALKIVHVWKRLRERFPDFPDWECRPGSSWNYALCLALGKGPTPTAPAVLAQDPPASSYFTVTHPRRSGDASPWESSPIELTCKARRVKGWELLEKEVTPDVPPSPVTTDSPEQLITLVPYGCTRIRITHFPVADKGAHDSGR
ncbi:MAG: beta-L-arabinofuranosidase domain-containing protein, partial [Isosphaeraceae bacterium]